MADGTINLEGTALLTKDQGGGPNALAVEVVGTSGADALPAGTNLIGKVAIMGKVTTDGDTAVTVASSTEAASSKVSTGMLEAIMRMLSATGTVQPVLSAGSQNDGGSALTVLPMAQLVYNGSTYDRLRSNHEVTVLASAARTGTVNSSDLTNYNGKGVVVTVDVTAIVSSPSITVDIKYKDTLSGKYVSLLTSAAIIATGTTKLVVYPGVTVAANVAASHPLPRVWRVEVTHGNANSITYSVSANYIE